MSTYGLLSLLAIVLLVAASAFFAGSETALTAVSRGVMHRLERDGVRAAADVNRLIDDRERLIGALLLGNTFVNILASSLATALLASAFGPRAVVIATMIMTFTLLVFGEVLPKTLAIARTSRFALAVAGAVRAVVYVLAPVVGSVQWLVWSVLNLFGVESEEPQPVIPAHEEIRGAVYLHHKEGGVEREHRDMISGVLDLRELTVGKVMVHRKNIVALNADSAMPHLLDEIINANHTRLPLWRDQPDNIIGVLHTKDVVRAIVRRKGAIESIEVASLASPPWFVPETTTLEEQLAAFRAKRTHFAIVVDEYGALQGLVTLEDILDEILGDIPDEHEVKERPGIRRLTDGSYAIDGDIPVRDINRALEWDLPDEIATTIAGLVINEARTIPEIGQRFAFFGFEFEILRRQRNQITAVRVTPPSVARISAPATPQTA
jgi:Mg2+/Co2+ transporter CorB